MAGKLNFDNVLFKLKAIHKIIKTCTEKNKESKCFSKSQVSRLRNWSTSIIYHNACKSNVYNTSNLGYISNIKTTIAITRIYSAELIFVAFCKNTLFGIMIFSCVFVFMIT